MNRFFGMMPSSEIKIEKQFKVGLGNKVTIQAGENGWTILYADSSSEYKDIINTSENNFNNAMEVLKTHFCEVVEI